MTKKQKSYMLNDIGEAVAKLSENATEFHGEMREFQKNVASRFGEVRSQFEVVDIKIDTLHSAVNIIGNDGKI